MPLRIGRALAERLALAVAAVVPLVPPLAKGKVPVTLLVRFAKVVAVVPYRH